MRCWAAVAVVLVGCVEQRAPAPTRPPAWPRPVVEAGPPPPEGPSCALEPAAVSELCQGGPPSPECPVRQLWRVRCAGVREIDLAVAPDGRALVAIASHSNEVFALDARAAGAPTLSLVGGGERVRAAFTPGAAPAPRVLALRFPYPPTLVLSQPAAVGWQGQSLPFEGRPVGFRLTSPDAGTCCSNTAALTRGPCTSQRCRPRPHPTWWPAVG